MRDQLDCLAHFGQTLPCPKRLSKMCCRQDSSSENCSKNSRIVMLAFSSFFFMPQNYDKRILMSKGYFRKLNRLGGFTVPTCLADSPRRNPMKKGSVACEGGSPTKAGPAAPKLPCEGGSLTFRVHDPITPILQPVQFRLLLHLRYSSVIP